MNMRRKLSAWVLILVMILMICPVTSIQAASNSEPEAKRWGFDRSADDTVDEAFTATSTYLANISLSYAAAPEVYPGTPEVVEAKDKTYTFETEGLVMTADGNVAASDKLEGSKGTFDDIKVDASAGKFQVQAVNNRVTINNEG